MTSLFTAALGLSAPWEVIDLDFEPMVRRIEFTVGCTAETLHLSALRGRAPADVRHPRARLAAAELLSPKKSI